MVDFAILDVPAGLDDFEPAQLAQRFRGARNRGIDRIVEALFRRTDNLYDTVDVFVHACLPVSSRVVNAGVAPLDNTSEQPGRRQRSGFARTVRPLWPRGETSPAAARRAVLW